MVAVLLAQASEVVNEAPGWILQLGFASPFVLALGFVGRWLIKRIEALEAERSQTNIRMYEDVLPAIRAGTQAIENTIAQQQALSAASAHYVSSLEETVRLQNNLLSQQGALLTKQEELRQEELRIAQQRGRTS